MFEIKEVKSKSEWKDFIDLPWSIYRGDANWVPPLKIAVRDVLNVEKNPFFRHAWMHPLVAYRGQECVGRIVGIIDENHNRFHNEKTALFGFFESIDDQKVANALLDAVAKWGKSKGMTTLRGPMNPSTNHECALLVEGFDEPASVMMTYNPKYYGKLLENWGLAKSKDLLAYSIHKDRSKLADRQIAAVERLKRRGRVTIRPVNMRRFNQEVEKIMEIYNDAWEHNWGFVPVEPEEFRHMAKDLKMVIDPELVLVAEVAGEPAGFALALPDVNQAIAKVPSGELLPTGLFKLLWHLKGPARKKTINRCRILTLGIKKQYQQFGIGPILYTEYFTRGPKLGYPEAEASWILEDNKAMNQALEQMCGQRTKVYRIYDRTLA